MLPALKRLYLEKGALGVLEWIYDKKRFFPVKLVLKTIFKVFPYEHILRTTAKYNQSIPSKGFVKSTQTYIKNFNIDIKQINSFDINGPCLIFGNHPTGLDPFIIASCLKRDDVYIVADNYQQRKGTFIGQHVIPIFYSRTQKNLENRGFLNSIGFYAMRQLTGYEEYETVKKQNQVTIQTAAKLLMDGHVVIIFPDGGSNNPELWYNGIGEIIKRTVDRENKIKLFAANIQGISSFKLWRHFLFNRKKYLQSHPAHVVISPQLTLASLCIESHQESREITERLRSEYKANKLWHPNYAYQQA